MYVLEMGVTVVTGNGILFDKQLPVAMMPFYCSQITPYRKNSTVHYGFKNRGFWVCTTMWLHQGTTITMLFYYAVRGSRLADKNLLLSVSAQTESNKFFSASRHFLVA